MSAPSDQQVHDPIRVIGPSLLLQVFYSLPLRDLLNCSLVSTTWYTLIDNHSTSIFRNLASDIVSDQKRLHFLKSLGQDEVRDLTSYNASFFRAGTFGSDKKISWRGICRNAVVTKRNWKHGRAKPGWLTPGRNTVWRMKVDPEENVLYMMIKKTAFNVPRQMQKVILVCFLNTPTLPRTPIWSSLMVSLFSTSDLPMLSRSTSLPLPCVALRHNKDKPSLRLQIRRRTGQITLSLRKIMMPMEEPKNPQIFRIEVT